jgi:hypothetical protein
LYKRKQRKRKRKKKNLGVEVATSHCLLISLLIPLSASAPDCHLSRVHCGGGNRTGPSPGPPRAATRASTRRARPPPPHTGQGAAAVPPHVPHPTSPSDQRVQGQGTDPEPEQVEQAGREACVWEKRGGGGGGGVSERVSGREWWLEKRRGARCLPERPKSMGHPPGQARRGPRPHTRPKHGQASGHVNAGAVRGDH